MELVALHGHEDVVWDVAALPDGSALFTGGADRWTRVWDAPQRALDSFDLEAR